MILHGYWRSSAAYRVRIALAWKGIDGDAGTLLRIETAVDGVAIGGGGQDFSRLADHKDRGIGTGEHRRSGSHHVVILTPDPALAGDSWIRDELFQNRVQVFRDSSRCR